MLLLQQVQACLLDLVNSFLSKAILRQADIDIFFFPFSARAEFFSEHVNFQPNFLLLVLGAFFFFFPPCLKNNGANRVVSSQSLNLKAEASKVSKCIFDFMSKEKKIRRRMEEGFKELVVTVEKHVLKNVGKISGGLVSVGLFDGL